MLTITAFELALAKVTSVCERLVFHFPEDGVVYVPDLAREAPRIGIRVDYSMGGDSCRAEVFVAVEQLAIASDEAIAKVVRVMVVESIQEHTLKGQSAIELLPRERSARELVRGRFIARRRRSRSA